MIDTQALLDGELHVEGRLVDASNATLYCRLGSAAGPACIYKPIAGERPLWDFPDGTLAGREVATYLIAVALGLRCIPPTVMREGPYGPGMVQTWIEADADRDLVHLVRDDDGDVQLTHSDHPALREMALFDAIVNNADRKGSHILVSEDGDVFGVDHGLCLHIEPKLRTVLWGWAGEPFTEEEKSLLVTARMACEGTLKESLAPHISTLEMAALVARIDALIGAGVFPSPPLDGRALPWPPV